MFAAAALFGIYAIIITAIIKLNFDQVSVGIRSSKISNSFNFNSKNCDEFRIFYVLAKKKK